MGPRGYDQGSPQNYYARGDRTPQVIVTSHESTPMEDPFKDDGMFDDIDDDDLDNIIAMATPSDSQRTTSTPQLTSDNLRNRDRTGSMDSLGIPSRPMPPSRSTSINSDMGDLPMVIPTNINGPLPGLEMLSEMGSEMGDRDISGFGAHARQDTMDTYGYDDVALDDIDNDIGGGSSRSDSLKDVALSPTGSNGSDVDLRVADF